MLAFIAVTKYLRKNDSKEEMLILAHGFRHFWPRLADSIDVVPHGGVIHMMLFQNFLQICKVNTRCYGLDMV